MPLKFPPLHDPERRKGAPEQIWGVWECVMGRHAGRFAPVDGKEYGQMEPESGVCVRTPGAQHCSGWHTRVRGVEHHMTCPTNERGFTHCTISPSSANFASDGTLTLTRYIRPFDLQYRAAFPTLGAYLENAVAERGLDTASMGRELLFLRSVSLKLPPEERLHALRTFTQTPQGTPLPSFEDAAKHYLATHPLAQHNTTPGAGPASLVLSGAISR